VAGEKTNPINEEEMIDNSIGVEELKNELEKLWEKNKHFPALIVSRHAQRLIPHLATQDGFEYWIDRDYQRKRAYPQVWDYRAKAFLTLYVTNQLSLQVWNKKIDKSVLKQANRDAGGYAVNASGVAQFVATTILLAADVAEQDELISCVNRAVSLVRRGFNEDWLDSKCFIVEIKKDVKFACSASFVEEVAECRLWHEEIPSSILSLFKEKFSPALKSLIGDMKGFQSQEALEKILVDYSALLRMSPEKSALASNKSTAENAAVKQDKLNRDSLVEGLAEILANQENSHHQTIGLLGHWGVGKSAVLNLLKEKLKKRHSKANFLFGEFNAWAYEHSKNIQAAMAHEVISSLTRFQGYSEFDREKASIEKRAILAVWNGIKHIAWSVIVRSRLSLGFALRKYPLRFMGLVLWLLALFLTSWVTWEHAPSLPELGSAINYKFILALMGMVVTLSRIPKDFRALVAQPFTKELLTYVELPNYAKHIGELSEMRNDIHLMCDLRLRSGTADTHYWLGTPFSPKRLLFVVDDLDRCGPDGIVKTLEAVRLILDIPQVTVVIAVDQRIALAALALHYKALTEYQPSRDAKSIARDYLGKIIHYPIVLKEPDYATVQGYMSSIWDDGDPEAFTRWQDLLYPAQEASADGIAENEVEIEVPVKSQEHSDEEKSLSESELAELVLSFDSPSIRDIFGLSDEQKASFAFWCNKLDLTNPRQLKRLDNSYNLLRKVHQTADRQITNDTPPAFGWLTCLLVLEFVSDEDDLKKRCEYLCYLRGETDKLASEKKTELDEALKVIDQAAELEINGENLAPLQKRVRLLEDISLFVLPAIDGKLALEVTQRDVC